MSCKGNYNQSASDPENRLRELVCCRCLNLQNPTFGVGTNEELQASLAKNDLSVTSDDVLAHTGVEEKECWKGRSV